jgi:hypothetical protein
VLRYALCAAAAASLGGPTAKGHPVSKGRDDHGARTPGAARPIAGASAPVIRTSSAADASRPASANRCRRPMLILQRPRLSRRAAGGPPGWLEQTRVRLNAELYWCAGWRAAARRAVRTGSRARAIQRRQKKLRARGMVGGGGGVEKGCDGAPVCSFRAVRDCLGPHAATCNLPRVPSPAPPPPQSDTPRRRRRAHSGAEREVLV